MTGDLWAKLREWLWYAADYFVMRHIYRYLWDGMKFGDEDE